MVDLTCVKHFNRRMNSVTGFVPTETESKIKNDGKWQWRRCKGVRTRGEQTVTRQGTDRDEGGNSSTPERWGGDCIRAYPSLLILSARPPFVWNRQSMRCRILTRCPKNKMFTLRFSHFASQEKMFKQDHVSVQRRNLLNVYRRTAKTNKVIVSFENPLKHVFSCVATCPYGNN